MVMEHFVYMNLSIAVIAGIALIYAIVSAEKIKSYAVSNERVRELSEIIQSGAMA